MLSAKQYFTEAFFIMTHMLWTWHERKLQHSVFLSGCVSLIPCVVCCASYYGNLSQTVLASLQGSKYSLNSRLLLLSPFLCVLYVYTLKMGVPVQSHIAEWNNGRESSRLFHFIWKRQTYFRSQARFYLLNLMNRWRTHAQMHSPIELMTSCVNLF